MEKRESTTTLAAALPERSDQPSAQWKPLVAASLGLMPLGAVLFFVSDRPAGLAAWGSYLFVVGVITLLAGLSSAWVDRELGRFASETAEGRDAEEEMQNMREVTDVPRSDRP